MRKNIFTRSACVLTAAFLLVCSVMMFMPGAAVKANAAGDGFWSLYEVVTEGDNEWKDGWNKTEYEYTVKAEPGKYTYSWKCNVDYYSASGDLLNLKGDASTVICTNTAPPSIINGGDTVSVGAVLNGHYEKRSFSFEDPSDFADGGNMSICAIYNNNGNDYSFFSHGGSGDTLYTSEEEPTVSRTFTCEIRGGRRDGDELAIRVSSTHGAMCHYKYRWFSGEEPDDSGKEEESCWKQVDRGQTDTYIKGSATLAEQFSDAEWLVSEGTFYFKNTKKNMTRESRYPEDHSCAGENVEQTLTIDLPQRTYKANETISLNLNSTVTHNTKHDPLPPCCLRTYLCRHEKLGIYGDNITLKDDSENLEYGFTMVENGGYRYNADGETEFAEWDYDGLSTVIGAQFPEGNTDGEELWLVEEWDGKMCYWYKYVWVEGKGSDKDKTDSDNKDDSSEPEEKYYWKYDGTVKTYGDSPAGSLFEDGYYVYDNSERSYRWDWQRIDGGYRFSYKCLYNDTNDYDAEFHDKGKCKDEFVVFRTTATPLKENYEPGEIVNMRIKLDAEKSKYLCPILQSWCFAYITGLNPDEDYPMRMDSRAADLRDSSGESQLAFGFTYADSPNESIYKDVEAKMPEDAEEGDVVYIVMHGQTQEVYYQTGLRYVFTKGEPTDGGIVAFTGTDGGGSDTIDKNASDTPGEDDGVTIPLKVFGGVMGVTGTVAAVMAATGKKKNGKEQQSRFRMVIYKEFGDAIKKGAPPVDVFARIAEDRPDGTEKDRIDLTQEIYMFTPTAGMELTPLGMVNGYMGARVRIPDANSPLTEAVVSARFSSFGGYFTENVKFRIAGKPYLEFLSDTTPVRKLTSLAALMSDRKTYDINLQACDFAETPTSLVIEKHSNAEDGAGMVNVTFDKTGNYTYKVHIENVSPVGYRRREPKFIDLKFTVSNTNESAEAVFRFTLCHEGISVLEPPLDKFGRLVINTEDADPGEGVRIDPTVIKFVCAYKNEKGETVIAEDGFDLSRLQPTDDRTRHVLCEFECEINNVDGDKGSYYIKPKKVLLVDKADPLLVSLPVGYPVGSPKYTLDLPVQLDGEPLPDKNLLDRDQEWELLRRACQRYGLTNNGKAQELMRAARGSDVPASVLRQIRYAICYEAKVYYEKEAEQMTALGDKMDRCVTICSTAKWFGEQATSYLIKYISAKCKVNGDLIEFIIMPIWCEGWPLLGEKMGADFWGDEVDISQKVLTVAETYAENGFFSLANAMIGGDKNIFTGTDYGATRQSKKMIGGMIAGYLVTCWAKHYFIGGKEKGKWFPSLLAAFKDCTVNALKAYFGKMLGKWLNDPNAGSSSRFTVSRDNTHVSSSRLDNIFRSFFKYIRTSPTSQSKFKRLLERLFKNERAFFGNPIQGGESLRTFDSRILGGSAIDATLDAILNSSLDTLSAWWDGKSAVVKFGEAEFHFSVNELFEIIGELPYVGEGIKWLYDTVCGLFKGDDSEPFTPYTPEDEIKELDKRLKAMREKHKAEFGEK